jgi:hypothetical protein
MEGIHCGTKKQYFFSVTCLNMYFIKRKAEYSMITAKEELSWAKPHDQIRKQQRNGRKPAETDPDKPTKPVRR